MPAREDAAVQSVLEYLKNISELRRKNSIHISDDDFYLEIDNLRRFPEYIHIYDPKKGRLYSEDSDTALLMTIKMPKDPKVKAKMPRPSKRLESWLETDWPKKGKAIKLKDSIRTGKNGRIRKTAVNGLEKEFKHWKEEYDYWLDEKKRIADFIEIKDKLFNLYREMELDQDSRELVVANAFFLSKKDNEFIKYPLISRSISINFDKLNRVIYIEDASDNSVFYDSLIQDKEMIDYNPDEIKAKLEQSDYHPLDADSPEFVNELSRLISYNGIFIESAQEVPEDWEEKGEFLFYDEPVLIKRKRIDGMSRFLSNIIDGVASDSADEITVPEHVKEILFPRIYNHESSINLEDLPIEKELAIAAGEDSELLMAKPANREQLEVAYKAEEDNGVVVQGPPGTGKTHIIANLTGHFLAKGKTVLITSYTSKALEVLKNKIKKEIQPLAVSLLDDTNRDIEESIQNIIEVYGTQGISSLQKRINKQAEERKKTIDKLDKARRELYELNKEEIESISLPSLDKDLAPIEAAKFVDEYRGKLDYIPGKIAYDQPFPLSEAELVELYGSNQQLSKEAEKDLVLNLPDVKDLIEPDKLRKTYARKDELAAEINNIRISTDNCLFAYDEVNERLIFDFANNLTINTVLISKDEYEELSKYVDSFSELKPALIPAIIAGKDSPKKRYPWEELITLIDETNKILDEYQSLVISQRNNLELSQAQLKSLASEKENIELLAGKLKQKDRLSIIDKWRHKTLLENLSAVEIKPEVKDFELILKYIDYQDKKADLEFCWDELIKANNGPAFKELGENGYNDKPELIALNYRDDINNYLNLADELSEKLYILGIQQSDLYAFQQDKSRQTNLENLLEIVQEVLPFIVEVNNLLSRIEEYKAKNKHYIDKLLEGKNEESELIQATAKALEGFNADEYERLYNKFAGLKDLRRINQNRKELLEKLKKSAPAWALAIQNREGVHGEARPPKDIKKAWQWKCLDAYLDELNAESTQSLENKISKLSQAYRDLTGQYSANLAWKYLLKRLDANPEIQQNLTAWKNTVKKIGKGTGKRVPKLRKDARKYMAKAQEAIPAWIMPIDKVINTVDPRTTHFDVLIVDEASQANITALGLLFLADKIIIVGDDEQVSPAGVGVSTNVVDSLKDKFLGQFDSAALDLLDEHTSLYDIASTTFSPKMLREHFRSVPEIIGFSDYLSYHGKIKPLRDASSSDLLPAICPVRVPGAEREDDHNMAEALAIVKLIKACIAQPEYKGKSMGIITLLGNEQADLIQRLINKHIDLEEIEDRQILAGKASQFQGDERDVMFISLVDSGRDDGLPIRLKGFGSGEQFKKNYNVAISRARDQVFIVHSLDPNNDLQDGDIRKTLLEYAHNPEAFAFKADEIEAASDSPFEKEVATALIKKGYDVKQQWEVGAYRLDMVVSYKNQRIAIECDGERYHSGAEKIKEDMARQTVLERVGWRFIRIKGSTYYHDKEATIEKLCKRLNDYGIKPSPQEVKDKRKDSELVRRLKRTYHEISLPEEEKHISKETIALAYDKDHYKKRRRA